MTYSYLWADSLYTGISSGSTLGIAYGKPLPSLIQLLPEEVAYVTVSVADVSDVVA